MATVEEIREVIADERLLASEMAERSLGAVSHITAVGSFWLTAFGLTLAVLAIIGFAAIFLGARKMARSVAEARIKSYLEGEKGEKFVRNAIRAEIISQMEGRIFTAVMPQVPPNGEESFKKDPKSKGD